MNLRDEFERIMREQREIALATMSEGLPHVRIVNFYYDTETHCVYFVTFKDNEKVVELAANPSIAFTTVPHNNTRSHSPRRWYWSGGITGAGLSFEKWQITAGEKRHDSVACTAEFIGDPFFLLY